MTPTEMTVSDLRALAQLVDDREVVVVRHENLLAVLRLDVLPPRTRRTGTTTQPETAPQVSSKCPRCHRSMLPDLSVFDGGATQI